MDSSSRIITFLGPRVDTSGFSQFFHQDSSDLVGLLCIARALEGGESDIVSVHNVYNILQKEHPEVVKTLTEPVWYFDRKGEVSEGEEPYIRNPVLYLEPGGQRRVYCKYDILFSCTLNSFYAFPLKKLH